MYRPSQKNVILIFLIFGSFAFLFFSKASLADTFFFLAGVVGIVSYYKVTQLHSDLEDVKKRVTDRFDELESLIEKNKTAKDIKEGTA